MEIALVDVYEYFDKPKISSIRLRHEMQYEIDHSYGVHNVRTGSAAKHEGYKLIAQNDPNFAEYSQYPRERGESPEQLPY